MSENKFVARPQYSKDEYFKAKGTKHQSEYRANVLKIDYNIYMNRLTEKNLREGKNHSIPIV